MEGVLSRCGHFVLVRDQQGVRHAIRHTSLIGVREDPDTGSCILITAFGNATVDTDFSEVVNVISYR